MLFKYKSKNCDMCSALLSHCFAESPLWFFSLELHFQSSFPKKLASQVESRTFVSIIFQDLPQIIWFNWFDNLLLSILIHKQGLIAVLSYPLAVYLGLLSFTQDSSLLHPYTGFPFRRKHLLKHPLYMMLSPPCSIIEIKLICSVRVLHF